MGDTANGSWSSAELGGYIRREKARTDAMQHQKLWVIQSDVSGVWTACDLLDDGVPCTYTLKAEAQDALDEIMERSHLHPNCYRIVDKASR